MLGGSVAAVVAVLVVSVALGSAGNEAPPAPAVLSATELSELQAKGQRIVVARADRDVAAYHPHPHRQPPRLPPPVD